MEYIDRFKAKQLIEGFIKADRERLRLCEDSGRYIVGWLAVSFAIFIGVCAYISWRLAWSQ